MKKISRVKAIRLRCIDCSDGIKDRQNCPHAKCELWPFRMGKLPQGNSPKRAIKQYCAWCSNSPYEVKNCTDKTCALYAFIDRTPIDVPPINRESTDPLKVGYILPNNAPTEGGLGNP